MILGYPGVAQAETPITGIFSNAHRSVLDLAIMMLFVQLRGHSARLGCRSNLQFEQLVH